MGGSIAVTLCLPGGEEHRMCRWTNPLPRFVVNVRFAEKDPAHVAAWLNQWEEMRADYLAHAPKHGGDGKFAFPMTEVYGDHVLLAPTDYGLVVLDMQRDVVLSAQGYCSFWHTFPWYGDEADQARVRALHAHGRILCLSGGIRGTHEQVEADVADLSGDELCALYLDQHDPEGPFVWVGMEVDLRPFEVVEFEESAEGFRAMREAVVDLGFRLTDEEEAQWAKYLERFDEED